MDGQGMSGRSPLSSIISNAALGQAAQSAPADCQIYRDEQTSISSPVSQDSRPCIDPPHTKVLRLPSYCLPFLFSSFHHPLLCFNVLGRVASITTMTVVD
jgi:hypothetical protein